MRAAVTGRDGHCRYPGCEEPATTRQMDHVIEYDNGGATTPANLHRTVPATSPQHQTRPRPPHFSNQPAEPLCGLFADGTWQSTGAEGPLCQTEPALGYKLGYRKWRYRNAQREEALKRQRLTAESKPSIYAGDANTVGDTSRHIVNLRQKANSSGYSDVLKAAEHAESR